MATADYPKRCRALGSRLSHSLCSEERPRPKDRNEESEFWLAVSGTGSTPDILALSSVAVSLLIAFSYVKNRVLTTLEPGHNPGMEGNVMRKAMTYVKIVMASVAEVATALGASLVASVGPLA